MNHCVGTQMRDNLDKGQARLKTPPGHIKQNNGLCYGSEWLSCRCIVHSEPNYKCMYVTTSSLQILVRLNRYFMLKICLIAHFVIKT